MHSGLHNSHLWSHYRTTGRKEGQKISGAAGEEGDVRFTGNYEALYETLAVHPEEDR